MSSSLDYEMETYADAKLDANPDFGAEDDDEDDDEDEEEDEEDMEDEDDEEEAEDEPAAGDNDVRRHLRGTRQLQGGWKHGHLGHPLGHHGGWKYHGHGGWPHHGGHHGGNRRCHGPCYRWSPRRQRCVIRRRCMW
jgi:hypothetical protein